MEIFKILTKYNSGCSEKKITAASVDYIVYFLPFTTVSNVFMRNGTYPLMLQGRVYNILHTHRSGRYAYSAKVLDLSKSPSLYNILDTHASSLCHNSSDLLLTCSTWTNHPLLCHTHYLRSNSAEVSPAPCLPKVTEALTVISVSSGRYPSCKTPTQFKRHFRQNTGILFTSGNMCTFCFSPFSALRLACQPDNLRGMSNEFFKYKTNKSTWLRDEDAKEYFTWLKRRLEEYSIWLWLGMWLSVT